MSTVLLEEIIVLSAIIFVCDGKHYSISNSIYINIIRQYNLKLVSTDRLLLRSQSTNQIIREAENHESSILHVKIVVNTL